MVVGSYNFQSEFASAFGVDEREGVSLTRFGQSTSFIIMFTLVRKLI